VLAHIGECLPTAANFYRAMHAHRLCIARYMLCLGLSVTLCLNSIETDDGTGMLFSAEAALGIVKEREFAISKNKSASLWNLALNSEHS